MGSSPTPGTVTNSLSIAPLQAGPHVWRGEALVAGDWTWRLSPHEIQELLDAAAPFANAHESELAAITAERFPLPTLSEQLVALRHRLISGLGFELLRGFPAGELSEQQSASVFAGIGAHLGTARSQNADGDLVGHVRNVGLDSADPQVRIYQTAQRQTFHTDSSDVVGLMCLNTAAEGGVSLLVSGAAIYNEMTERDPELAASLFEPLVTDRRGEVPPGARPYYTIPVLSWFDDALTVMYQRQYIESAVRLDGIAPLTDRVRAALDLFDEIANDPALHLRMELEVGDMQFVYNHSLLHDRTAFVDRPGSPRHLLRLWLSIPGDRALPAVFAERFGSTTVGDRGGVVVAT